MRLIIFILAFVPAYAAYADCQVRVDADGYKQGAEKCLFPWGRMDSYTHYVANRKNGRRKQWGGGDGKLASDETYRDDQLNGPARYYSNELGTLAEERDYVGGKLQGVIRKYGENGKEGRLESIESFVDDKRQGPSVTFYPEGKLKEVTYYSNDTRDGRYELYWEDGRRNEVAYYKDGHKDGEAWVYYPSGKLRMFANYLQGLLQGISKDYREDGKERAMHCYQNDQEVKDLPACAGAGKKERIKLGFRNGATATEYTVDRGLRSGESVSFYEAGNAREIAAFQEDRPEGSFRYFFANAKIEREVTFHQGEPDGEEKSFYENGITRGALTWVRGMKMAERSFYATGKAQAELTYGKACRLRFFYPNGTPRLDLSCRGQGELVLDGAMKSFFDDGGVESESTLRDGRLEGVAKDYSRGGKLATRTTYKNGQLIQRVSFDDAGGELAVEGAPR